jgi:hypothetical protein
MTIRIVNFPDGFTSSTTPPSSSGEYETYAPEEIGADGGISIDTLAGFQRREVYGDGDVNASLTPFGSVDVPDGTVITLIGTDNLNPVTILFNNNDYGAFINGNIRLEQGVSITLQYNATDKRYYEIGRNN